MFDGHGTVTWSVAVSRRLLASVLAGIVTGSWAFAGEDALPASKCEGASRELLGSPAVRPGAKAGIPEPKKVKHVHKKSKMGILKYYELQGRSESIVASFEGRERLGLQFACWERRSWC